MWIGREKVFRTAVKVSEVAASAAGDEDLLADTFGTFQDGNPPAAFTCLDGAHQAGGAGAKHDHIEEFSQETSFEPRLMRCQNRS